MTIGQALKRERTRLNLSQKEMAGNILSRSYYGKVETDKSEITVDKLIKLLKFHQIDILSFFENLDDTKTTSADFEENLSNQLGDVFYAHDIDAARKLKEKIDQTEVSDELKIRAVLVIATMTNDFSNIDTATKQRIRQLLFVDNWTDNQWTLRLFGNSMQLFSKTHLDIYMSQILKRYQNISEFPLKKQERICGICINYLYNTYKSPSLKVWSQTLTLLKLSSQYPSLSIYKLDGIYFRALIEKDISTISNIRNLLFKDGDSRLLNILPNI